MDYMGELQELPLITECFPPAPHEPCGMVDKGQQWKEPTGQEWMFAKAFYFLLSFTQWLCEEGINSHHFTDENAEGKIIIRGI